MKKWSNQTWMLVGVAVMLVTGLLYYLLALPGNSELVNLINRDIDSSLKLWLNGYLAAFFRIKIMGNFSWLVLPVFIWSLLHFRKLESWQKVFWLFYAVAVFIIALKGYFNFRYVLVLVPVNMAILIYALYHLEKGFTKRLGIVIAVLSVMHLANTGKYLKEDLWEKYASRAMEVVEKPAAEASVGVFDYLESSYGSSGQQVLVNNLPEYYFHSSLKGIYFWSGNDVYYDAEGEHELLANRSTEEVAQFVLEQLGCQLVLSHENLNPYHTGFEAFLESQCQEVFRDGKGYILYEVKSAS